jgi:hypothetical protein
VYFSSFIIQFSDTGGEVELRLDIRSLNIESSSDVFVDADDTSLLIRVKSAGILKTLIDVNQLFERVKSSETIWYVLLVNLVDTSYISILYDSPLNILVEDLKS